MNTPFTNFEELWAAVNRLYQVSVKHDEALVKHGEALTRIEAILQTQAEAATATEQRLDRLVAQVAVIASAVAQHEQRLERLEDDAE